MENIPLPEGLSAEASKVNALARQLPSRDQGVERPREQQRPRRPKAVVKPKPRGARPQGGGQGRPQGQGEGHPQGQQGGKPNPNRQRRRNRHSNG